MHNNSFNQKAQTSNADTNSKQTPPQDTSGSQDFEALNTTMAHATDLKLDSNPLVLLSTAKVIILDTNKKGHMCKALLGSGSQSNLISRSLANKLNLKLENFSLPLVGVNQQVTNITHKVKATIKSYYSTYTIDLVFLVLPTITEKVPSISFDNKSINCPSHIKLADPDFNISGNVDLLLGANIFYDLLCPNQMKINDTLLLQESLLGWILAGSVALGRATNRASCNTITNITNEELNNNLKKFWEIEELPKQNYLLPEQQLAKDYFIQTTKRDEKGKFVVRLPFLRELKNYGDSYTIALKRFKSLEYKFARDIELK